MRWDIILPVAIAILFVVLVVALLHRAVRVAIVAVILAVILPIMVTILCGEGEDYVARFSSLFTPAIEQKINDGYRDYSELEKNDPVLDLDGVNDALEGLWDTAREKIG